MKIALLGYFKSVELKGAKYFHLNDETWKRSDYKFVTFHVRIIIPNLLSHLSHYLKCLKINERDSVETQMWVNRNRQVFLNNFSLKMNGNELDIV